MVTKLNVALVLVMTVLPGHPAAAIDEAETLAVLPHLADEVMVRWGVPGMAVAVVRSDGVVFSGGFGVTRLGGDEIVTADTVFGVGSVTKPVTAMSAALLVDEGKLAWDETVRTWLPDFRLQDLYASLHATPRDLLAHRTGLPRHDLVWYGSGNTRAELIELLPYLGFRHELRAQFEYTNLMYAVVGHLVGEVAGSTYEEFVATRIFEPLGMADSGFIPPSREGTARPHAVDESGELTEIPMFVGGSVAPAAGLYSSANDLARFLRMVLKRGAFDGSRLLSEDVLMETLTPQVALRNLGPRELPITNYGLGWFLSVYRGHLYAWHSGSTDGYHAYIGVLPYDDLGVVVLTNRLDHEALDVLSRWIFDRFLGLSEINWQAALKDRDRRVREVQHDAEVRLESIARPDEPPTRPLGDYVGVYRNPAYGRLEVSLGDDGLVASFHGLDGPLLHSRGDLFLFELPRSVIAPSFLVGFTVDPEVGVTAAWSPLQRDLEPIVFTRVEPTTPGA
jgi:CubicO group peptidase (beta-lactamase class C family)